MKLKISLISLGLIIGSSIFVYQYIVSTQPESNLIIPDLAELNSEEEVVYWINKIKQIGGVKSYQEFKNQYSSEDNVDNQHQKAHIFGEALYKAMGVGGVPVCDSDFGFGCYHSFFGFAILDKGLAVLPELDQACIEAYGNKGLGCQHGIGHGVIVEMGYEEFANALDECSKLDWKGPVGGCTSGVLMEYNHHTMENSGIRRPVDKNYHYPCDVVEDRFIEACYFEQPAWWSALSNSNFTFIGEECEKAPAGKARTACYRGVGNVAAGILNFKIPETLASCQAMPNLDGEVFCVEGAAWIISYNSETKDTWTELCEPYEAQYRQRCLASHDFI